MQTFFLARKHFRDFAELLFGQRRGLPDTFRSILLHFSEKLAEVARDVLDLIRIDRAFERLRFLHSATNGGHILRVSLTMFQHEAAHGVVHLILRGNTGSQNALLIERDLAGQLREFRIFQKLTDHRMVQLALMEIGSCFHRQPQTLDVISFAGRNIRQSQQKIRRNFKVIRDGDKIFTGQFACFFSHYAAQCAFVHTDSLRQLNLRDVSASAQVADSVHCISGKPFFLHPFILLSFFFDRIISDSNSQVKSVAFLHRKSRQNRSS